MLAGRFGVRLHGYVLMPDHYHLQVETPEANLSQAIHWRNVGYSVWLNRNTGGLIRYFKGALFCRLPVKGTRPLWQPKG
jgi:REP element-mobilizing transposase RayT